MSPQRYAGFRIIVEEPRQKMKLSPELRAILAPKAGFADEMDAWLRSFFGMSQPTLKDGEVMQYGSETLFMNQRTYSDLQAAIACERNPRDPLNLFSMGML